jgi:hypothetical protein
MGQRLRSPTGVTAGDSIGYSSDGRPFIGNMCRWLQVPVYTGLVAIGHCRH